nr:MAG TPA: hypothetical protein [Inoviridae sp.]
MQPEQLHNIKIREMPHHIFHVTRQHISSL